MAMKTRPFCLGLANAALLSLALPVSASNLTEVAKLVASDAAQEDSFGIATCPCGDAASILDLYGMFEFDGPQVINTGIEPEVVFYNARDSLDSIPNNPQLVLNANTSVGEGLPVCIYRMTDEVGTFVINEEHGSLSAEEGERCRNDIIDVIGLIKDVDVDIKPADGRNRVNPRSNGRLRVAVLSDTDAPFDPLQIGILSVRFGPDGARAIGHNVRDVNKDGLGDLVVHFEIRDAGIKCGANQASIRGRTLDRQKFRGVDSIKTIGCK